MRRMGDMMGDASKEESPEDVFRHGRRSPDVGCCRVVAVRKTSGLNQPHACQKFKKLRRLAFPCDEAHHSGSASQLQRLVCMTME